MILTLNETRAPRCLLALLIMIGLFCIGCDGSEKPTTSQTQDDEYEDIKVVDGKVCFFLSESAEPVRTWMGVGKRAWNKASVSIDGISYPVETDIKGRHYINVAASDLGIYNAVLTTTESSDWYGASAYADVKLPYSQFWNTTAGALQSYPMYGAYTRENGNKMIFNDAFAVLDLSLTGQGQIVSVKVDNLAEKAIAGSANFMPSLGGFTINRGVDFVVLNCSNDGKYVALSNNAPKHFYVMLAPGEYPSGLKITVTDSKHQAVVHTLSAPTLVAGRATTVELKYAPDADLVYYESFDNFVWGGNIMGGQEAVGYAPTADNITVSTGTDRNGYSDSFAQVPCTNPGSAFIQPNTWSEVNQKTVGDAHLMSKTYVDSRNIGDYTYMFRCQEYQGCIACGTGNSARGICQTAPLQAIEGVQSVKVSFDFCYQYGSTDQLLFQIINGGMIASVTVDGKEVALGAGNSTYVGNSSHYILEKSYVTLPSSESVAKNWHRVDVVVNNATDGTMLFWGGNDVNVGVHGFYLDNIEVRSLGKMATGPNNLRVLYWNIQNGMWADQANNYNSFVEWVTKYDPDICVWCESATIYQNNTNSSQAASSRFLPDGWSALAARYGHSYTAIGGWRDNYPQIITSKYPISTLLAITNSDEPLKPISHGSAIQQVNVGGRKINIVTLHTWPQSYGYGVATADRAASTANHDGDKYREFEISYICAHTVNDAAYAAQQDWLMMGDFNSRSRVDNWYYGYAANDTRLLVHNHILDNTDLKDIIAERNPGCFISSTYGNSRIDYMYASPSMYDRVVNAMTVVDKWTTLTPSPYVSSFYYPSDHRPILVDFELK